MSRADQSEVITRFRSCQGPALCLALFCLCACATGRQERASQPAWVKAYPPRGCVVSACGRTYYRKDAITCATDAARLNLALRKSALVHSAITNDNGRTSSFDMQVAKSVKIQGSKIKNIWPPPSTNDPPRTYVMVCATESPQTAEKSSGLPLSIRASGMAGHSLYKKDAEEAAIAAARANLAEVLESSVKGLLVLSRKNSNTFRLNAVDVRAPDWAHELAKQAKVINLWRQNLGKGRTATAAELELNLLSQTQKH